MHAIAGPAADVAKLVQYDGMYKSRIEYCESNFRDDSGEKDTYYVYRTVHYL